MAKRKVGAIAPAVITRDEAKALGLKTYFTSIPCRHGHTAPRSVGANNECLECKRTRDAAYTAAHKVEKAEYDRAHRAAKPEYYREKGANWRAANAEQSRIYNAQYRADNADRLKAVRLAKGDVRAQQNKNWRAENKEWIAAYGLAYQSRRFDEDINYKLAARLRQRLATSIRAGTKAGSAVRNLGCTIPELKAHLERQFRPGMTWENWGKNGWHIDHIRPLAWFDLTDPDQVKVACHYTNLQPLWHSENCAKSARANWQRAA